MIAQSQASLLRIGDGRRLVNEIPDRPVSEPTLLEDLQPVAGCRMIVEASMTPGLELDAS